MRALTKSKRPYLLAGLLCLMLLSLHPVLAQGPQASAVDSTRPTGSLRGLIALPQPMQASDSLLQALLPAPKNRVVEWFLMKDGQQLHLVYTLYQPSDARRAEEAIFQAYYALREAGLRVSVPDIGEAVICYAQPPPQLPPHSPADEEK